MSYLYELPDEDREEAGLSRASDYALSEFLKLDLQDIPPGKRGEYIAEAWWKYVEKLDLSNDAASNLLDEIQAKCPPLFPYAHKYPKRFWEDVEEKPIYDLETWLKSVVGRSHLLSLYGQAPDAHYARYHWQILQERVNELTACPENTEAQHVKLPRLQAAITWLRGWEQHLAEADAKSRSATTAAPLTWLGGKVELAELGYALLESGKLGGGNRGATLKKLGELLGVSMGDNPATHLQTIQKRKGDTSATPFLDRLRMDFAAYLAGLAENDARRDRRHRPKILP